MALCLVSTAPEEWNLLPELGIQTFKGKSFRVTLSN
jgi:hypothetical protein